MTAHRSPNHVAGAEALQALVRTHFIPRLATPRMSDLDQDVSGLAARFVLERQTQALRSAVTLARDSLGHLALPFVRPACEERIWTAYLFALDEGARHRVLLALARLESTKTVAAQQQFLGTKEMKRLGFPRAFVNQQQQARESAESDLVDVGRVLGWPEDARPVPSVGWIASKAGLDSLYAFLYSASSKGVHFSPYEVLRSGWSESSDTTAAVTLMAEPYVLYRTDFTIHWLSVLLLDTLIVLAEAGLLADLALDDDANASFQKAVEDVGSAGRLPIALAAEFNISVDR